MGIERDPHAGPVPDAAWAADAEARQERGRVEIFNATRPGGLDGWTMDLRAPRSDAHAHPRDDRRRGR